MDFETGITHALNGNAILFVGSGFSRDAINLSGNFFKTGKDLAITLLKEVEIDETIPLKTAASIFLEKKGINHLFDFFKKEFKTKEITDSQKIITSLPWRRIYTTNYDDVIERAFCENGKSIESVTLTDSINQRGSIPLCIHLNGFVDTARKEDFSKTIRLTEESYDSETIKTSEWIELLRNDIKLAYSVFFVGYGLDDSDVELRWILNESEENKDKTFFITGLEPSYLEKRKISSFGYLQPIKSDGFADKIQKIKSAVKEDSPKDIMGSSFSEHRIAKDSRQTTSDDIFNLYCYGKLCNELTKNNDYLLRRKYASEMLKAIHTDTDILVIHSDIAGGKRICLQEFADMAVVDDFRVFNLLCVNCDTPKEFNIIQKIAQSKKCIIIINKFTYFYDNIIQLLKTKDQNIIIVFSSRTIDYEIFISKINQDFPSSNIVSLNISTLREEEIGWLIRTFKRYGLLGKIASNEDSEIKSIFCGRKCRSKMGSIILTIFDQPEVADRIQKEYSTIKNGDVFARKILVSLYIFSLLGCPRVYELLVRVWGIAKFNDNTIRNSHLRNFINFDSGNISAISSSFSRYILHIEDKAFILSLLSELFDKISNMRDFKKIRKDFMMYGKLTRLFLNCEKSDLLPMYYSLLTNKCHDEVLFWLQYAICMTMNGQYLQADKYFMTAYSLAEKINDFNPFQINNSYEKYLLLKSTTVPFEEAFDLFTQSHRKIMTDLNTQDDDILKFYPYRNMLLYEDFFNKFKVLILQSHKDEFVKKIQEALIYVQKKMIYKIYVSDIENCYHMLSGLLKSLSEVRS